MSEAGYNIPTPNLLPKKQDDEGEEDTWELRLGEDKRDRLRRVARLAMARELSM
jgi:hypothetical protein